MCSTSVAASAGTHCSSPSTALPSRRSTVPPPASTSLGARWPRGGLRLSLRRADADALPFADESFDYVLSWNVIFHGTMGDVGRRLAEIWRILKPGGLYQGTMLSKRDAQFGRGRPVAPDTFIRGSDAKGPCCTDQPVDAVIPCPRGLMRCGRSSGVPAPAYGSGRRQQLPLRPLDARWFASAAHDR